MHLASVDGVIGPAAEARIPATDAGVLRGDGVFEVMRLYGGRPFALDEHLARMGRSAANLRLPIDLDAVRDELEALLAAAGAGDGLARVVVTRGGRRVVLLEPLPDLPPAVRLGCVTYAPPRILTGIKSLSYAANMLATRLAQERGFDEALLVTPHGRVLEAPTSSLFWVTGGQLLTPPLEDHILDSITRRAVMEGSGATEAPCTLDDLACAGEAFLASTVREVQPVAAVEQVELPTGPAAGPRTAQAARTLRERIGRLTPPERSASGGRAGGTPGEVAEAARSA
jgi:branched-chain amino acid aminotransferase